MNVVEGLETLTVKEACETLLLSPRRYYRWVHWAPPIKRQAWNQLMPEEERAIVASAEEETLADLRAAGLMVYGQESGKYHCSVATVQRVLRKRGMSAPYAIPRRRGAAKPDIRELMKAPKRVFSYDATDFYLTSRLRVVVIPMLDLGSRKFLHFSVKVRSFTQKDVMDLWDETLTMEGIEPGQLTSLSDRGGQMKGRRTKAHLMGRWEIKLEYARPYTPDDNAWIEAFIKYMKYHPDCPEHFDTVQDVMDWVKKFQRLYNDHPHSALGYVRPNEEHAGLGDGIRQQRKENLLASRHKRLAYYRTQREGISNHRVDPENASTGLLEACFEKQTMVNSQNHKKERLNVPMGGEDVLQNSSAVLCQNR